MWWLTKKPTCPWPKITFPKISQQPHKEVANSQKVLSSTAKDVGNILGLGRLHSNTAYSRCIDNCGSESEDVPCLKLFPKLHKDLDPKGHPKSRPVVTVASGLSFRAGDVLADYLEPIVNMMHPRLEDRLTKEVLCQLEEAEVKIRDEGHTDIMAGSLDVVSLYPSLDQEGSALAVERFIFRSGVTTTGVDFRAAQIFLSSNLSETQVKSEGLQGLLPRHLRKK